MELPPPPHSLPLLEQVLSFLSSRNATENKNSLPSLSGFVFQKHNPLEKGIYVREQNVLLGGMRKVESPSDEDKMHLTQMMRERVWEASEGERDFLSS